MNENLLHFPQRRIHPFPYSFHIRNRKRHPRHFHIHNMDNTCVPLLPALNKNLLFLHQGELSPPHLLHLPDSLPVPNFLPALSFVLPHNFPLTLLHMQNKILNFPVIHIHILYIPYTTIYFQNILVILLSQTFVLFSHKFHFSRN